MSGVQKLQRFAASMPQAGRELGSGPCLTSVNTAGADWCKICPSGLMPWHGRQLDPIRKQEQIAMSANISDSFTQQLQQMRSEPIEQIRTQRGGKDRSRRSGRRPSRRPER